MAHRKYPKDALAGYRIVVIDDEPDGLELARSILEFYGADVQIANGGAQGLDLVRAERPALLITDLSMPHFSGWDVLQDVRADDALADLPVVALTAHAMAGDRERVMEAGFTGYITKPLNASSLIDQLMTLIKQIE